MNELAYSQCCTACNKTKCLGKSKTHTPQYRQAVELSQYQGEEHKRLSHQLWWAQYDYTNGRSLHIKVLDGIVKFDDLESEEQKLVDAIELRSYV